MIDDSSVRVLDAAERLVYARGIHAVGVDDIRDQAGVSLRRIYQLYPSKDAIVVACLERLDQAWRDRVQAFVDGYTDPEERLLAVFGCLQVLFAEDNFRGCVWINANGESGSESAVIAELAQNHKTEVRSLVGALVKEADLPATLTDQLCLLIEGALTTAGIFHTTDPATHAQQAAAALIHAARSSAAESLVMTV